MASQLTSQLPIQKQRVWESTTVQLEGTPEHAQWSSSFPNANQHYAIALGKRKIPEVHCLLQMFGQGDF
jgi:hypothetical protein